MTGDDTGEKPETENFANYPQSITEVRADRESDMRVWSPRDIAVAFLRDIDSGKTNPDAAIIIWRDVDENGETSTSHAKACPDIHTAVGLCHRASHIIQRQWDNN